MQISLLNERITFQRNVILTDHIGNHMSSWNDEFSCYATVGDGDCQHHRLPHNVQERNI